MPRSFKCRNKPANTTCSALRICSAHPVAQAAALGDASASAAAWCLSGHVEEALGRTTAVRDGLYGSLLAALQLRLAEASLRCRPLQCEPRSTAVCARLSSPAFVEDGVGVQQSRRPEAQTLLVVKFGGFALSVQTMNVVTV